LLINIGFQKSQPNGAKTMAKRIQLELELPDEIFADLNVKNIESTAREALVMALLREHRFSQGKTAEILGINRHELFDLIKIYRVPAIDLTAEELKQELEKPLLNF
jgi:predicted HTH domain antitoxin